MSTVPVCETSKAWPYVEARRLLKHIERKGKTPGDVVTFETGYGPSGAPHIGTFAEVVRTLWVMKAFDDLTENAYKTRLIMFSDDYDAMRKVPDGMPEWMNDHLGKPLTHVPSPYPFEDIQEASFGQANNELLARFVSKILESYDGGEINHVPSGARYCMASSSEYYWAGAFNELLDRVWDTYVDIQDIMLPSLGEDRRATYSPFMVLSDAGHLIQSGVLRDVVRSYVTVGDRSVANIHNGRTKLQWKVDWAMRWVYFDVDYEMSGKDLTESVRLSGQICRALGGTPPVNLTYELFLDKDGAKISKSKGNGFTVDEWLSYGTPESLAYFLYREPTRAKNLHPGMVPKAMDEYANSLKLYAGQTPEQQLGNPVHHIHNGNVPEYQEGISYSMLINLIGSTGITDVTVVNPMASNYLGCEVDMTDLITLVGNYFNDHLAADIVFREPTLDEADQLLELLAELYQLVEPTVEIIQGIAYEIGKRHEYENLQDWFKVIYEVVFGSPQGPRIGPFAMMVGLDRFIRMIELKLA